MLFKTRSASVYGIEAHLVDVEVNLTTGTNGEFHIVGLPDVAVRESRSRVIAAIRNSGFSFPYQRIIVNLAPADIKKEGSAFDLPLAIAILGGVGLLTRQDLSDFLLVGELSLDGKLRPVRGVLSIAMLAREKKIPCLIVAPGNAQEAAVVAGIEVHPMRSITEVVDFLNGNRTPRPLRVDPAETSKGQPQRGEDFRDVRGQFQRIERGGRQTI
jgi:magnesium chelatase family protein